MLPPKLWKLHRPSRPDMVRVSLMAVGTFYFAAIAWAILNGPGFYAAVEHQMIDEAEAESRVVCQRLGMPSGSSQYSSCASELTWVRQQYHERAARQLAG